MLQPFCNERNRPWILVLVVTFLLLLADLDRKSSALVQAESTMQTNTNKYMDNLASRTHSMSFPASSSSDSAAAAGTSSAADVDLDVSKDVDEDLSVLFQQKALKNRFKTSSIFYSPTRTLPKIAVVGSGNFGSVMAKVIGDNLVRHGYVSDEHKVKMWVFEENIGTRKLSEIINTDHENVKYLPGVPLPHNVQACTDVIETCQDADILVFVTPHQFLPKTLTLLKGHVSPHTLCVSLVKGIEFHPLPSSSHSDIDSKGGDKNNNSGVNNSDDTHAHAEQLELVLYSRLITQTLQLTTPCAVLVGANVAADVAQTQFVEATLAAERYETAMALGSLFDSDHFRVQLSRDVATVEICGAVKNVVALGAGLCDGLGVSVSAKAALMRRGLQETAWLCRSLSSLSSSSSSSKRGDQKYENTAAAAVNSQRNKQRRSFQLESLLLSSGVADTVATCLGGRNRRCAEAFCRQRLLVQQQQQQSSAGTTPPEETSTADSASQMTDVWSQIETSLLQGQRLQGVDVCRQLHSFIRQKQTNDRRLHSSSANNSNITSANNENNISSSSTNDSVHSSINIDINSVDSCDNDDYQLLDNIHAIVVRGEECSIARLFHGL